MRPNDPVSTYLQEAEELLAEIESTALSLADHLEDEEAINRLFRSFHTIKGSGAMFGFTRVAEFTHHVETLLDRVRTGEVAATTELAQVVLSSGDQIKALLAAEQGGGAVAAGSSERILAQLATFTGTSSPAPVEAQPVAAAESGQGFRTWRIVFRPNPMILAHGGNPELVFRELATLGECTVRAELDAVPPLEELNPDVCYLWWTITLTTGADENTIRDIFIFVEDGATLEVTPLLPQAPAGDKACPDAPAEEEPPPAVSAQPAGPHAPAKESTVRVPSARLDRLVNLVGELVMNQSRLAQASSEVDVPELVAPLEEIERLVAELRDDVLGIRMMPIGSIFGRFRRLIHDLSRDLGKQIELVMEGGDTELDKSILDQLGDPLVHLLRNSIDHGIEKAEQRRAAGKPEHGTIRLSAAHRGADVVVTVEDDGRGLDREVIRAKAIERQLISGDANLSDKEIYNLILLPGFSTSTEVTSVSGRGVGMDVVKRQTDALRGSLSISSIPGRSTAISLTLPLTLAIIEGLLVESAGEQYILPMAAVRENVELQHSERLCNNGRNVTSVRGDLIPYIDLRELFEAGGERPSIERIVIVHHEDQSIGLVVDRVLGTHQTVIQSLGRFFRNIEVVSGSTIMGDGCVALILDISGIARLAHRRAQATSGSRPPPAGQVAA